MARGGLIPMKEGSTAGMWPRGAADGYCSGVVSRCSSRRKSAGTKSISGVRCSERASAWDRWCATDPSSSRRSSSRVVRVVGQGHSAARLSSRLSRAKSHWDQASRMAPARTAEFSTGLTAYMISNLHIGRALRDFRIFSAFCWGIRPSKGKVNNRYGKQGQTS